MDLMNSLRPTKVPTQNDKSEAETSVAKIEKRVIRLKAFIKKSTDYFLLIITRSIEMHVPHQINTNDMII